MLARRSRTVQQIRCNTRRTQNMLKPLAWRSHKTWSQAHHGTCKQLTAIHCHEKKGRKNKWMVPRKKLLHAASAGSLMATRKQNSAQSSACHCLSCSHTTMSSTKQSNKFYTTSCPLKPVASIQQEEFLDIPTQRGWEITQNGCKKVLCH